MKKLLFLAGASIAVVVAAAYSPAQFSDPWAECLTQAEGSYTLDQNGNPVLGPVTTITCVTQSCAGSCGQTIIIPPPHTTSYSTCGCSGSVSEQCCDLLITSSGKVLDRTFGSCPACHEPGACKVVTIFNPEEGTYLKLPSCE